MFSQGFSTNKNVIFENQNIDYDIKNDTDLGFFDVKNGVVFDLGKKDDIILNIYSPKTNSVKTDSFQASFIGNNMYIFNNLWSTFAKIGYESINYDNINCLEINDTVIKTNISNCNTSGKDIYETNNNNPALKISGEKVILSSGIKNTHFSWDAKKILNFELKTIINNYETFFSSPFENLKNYQYKFLPEDPWIDTSLKAGYSHARKFGRWSLGFRLSAALNTTTSQNTINKKRKIH